MRWELHEQMGTLEVTFDEAPPPSREEVEGLLQQVQPLVSDLEVRALLLNGERVKRHQGLSYPEIAGPIRYEAARQRTARTQGLPTVPPARVAGDPAGTPRTTALAGRAVVGRVQGESPRSDPAER
jgi:hypothetical protein